MGLIHRSVEDVGGVENAPLARMAQVRVVPPSSVGVGRGASDDRSSVVQGGAFGLWRASCGLCGKVAWGGRKAIVWVGVRDSIGRRMK